MCAWPPVLCAACSLVGSSLLSCWFSARSCSAGKPPQPVRVPAASAMTCERRAVRCCACNRTWRMQHADMGSCTALLRIQLLFAQTLCSTCSIFPVHPLHLHRRCMPLFAQTDCTAVGCQMKCLLDGCVLSFCQCSSCYHAAQQTFSLCLHVCSMVMSVAVGSWALCPSSTEKKQPGVLAATHFRPVIRSVLGPLFCTAVAREAT